jgi:hypothetical protein
MVFLNSYKKIQIEKENLKKATFWKVPFPVFERFRMKTSLNCTVLNGLPMVLKQSQKSTKKWWWKKKRKKSTKNIKIHYFF